MKLSGLAPVQVEAGLRLDPAQLPARVVLMHNAGVERGTTGKSHIVRHIAEINAQRVLLTRCSGSMRQSIEVPVESYRGVERISGPETVVRLAHDNPDFIVPLAVLDGSAAGEDRIGRAAFEAMVEHDWQTWAEVLGRPAIGVQNADFGALAGLVTGRPRARRANSFFAERRPRFLTRRLVGHAAGEAILEGEREIIART